MKNALCSSLCEDGRSLGHCRFRRFHVFRTDGFYNGFYRRFDLGLNRDVPLAVLLVLLASLDCGLMCGQRKSSFELLLI